MAIDWDPVDENAEIRQCVNTLLKTAPGTVPLSRDLGTPQDLVDAPQSIAGARLKASVALAVRTYEPRAKVTGVSLEAGIDGKLTPTVKVAANG